VSGHVDEVFQSLREILPGLDPSAIDNLRTRAPLRVAEAEDALADAAEQPLLTRLALVWRLIEH
jgi:hypothetical protein